METNTVVVNGNQPSSRYGLGYHVLQCGYCLGHHVLHHLDIMCYNVNTVWDIMY